MNAPSTLTCAVLASLLGCASLRAEDAIREISADPASLSLRGPGASYSLLIHGKTADGRVVDLTGAARFRSLDPNTVDVSEAGVVQGVADGSGRIEVSAAGQTVAVAVKVE